MGAFRVFIPSTLTLSMDALPCLRGLPRDSLTRVKTAAACALDRSQDIRRHTYAKMRRPGGGPGPKRWEARLGTLPCDPPTDFMSSPKSRFGPKNSACSADWPDDMTKSMHSIDLGCPANASTSANSLAKASVRLNFSLILNHSLL